MIYRTKYTAYNYNNEKLIVNNFLHFVDNFLANNLVDSKKFRTFVTEHGTFKF